MEDSKMAENCGNKIVEEHRGADFNRRLHIYLEFPHLRSNFIQIDQSSRTAELSAGINFPLHAFLTN
jgi:hypothetical protein